MENKEIIKALECCGDEEELHWCTECPYYDKENDFCQEDLHRDAIDLINRQQAENENYSHNIKNLTAENMQLHAEIKRLNSCVKSEDEVRAIMKSQMTPMVKEIVNEQINVAAKLARAEAIKEFAERLKLHTYIVSDESQTGIINRYSVVTVNQIDNLVKEMVGEQE
jgi:phage host-nuclease inhibitor protein Gam